MTDLYSISHACFSPTRWIAHPGTAGPLVSFLGPAPGTMVAIFSFSAIFSPFKGRLVAIVFQMEMYSD